MGQYYIIDRASSNFNITATGGKAQEAARIIEELHQRNRAGLTALNMPDEWEWEPVFNAHGSIIGFNHGGDKLGFEQEVFGAIAHLVTPGSTLRFVHEDDMCWDITFDGVGFEEGGEFQGLASEAYAESNGLEINGDEEEWAEFDNFEFYDGEWDDTGL